MRFTELGPCFATPRTCFSVIILTLSATRDGSVSVLAYSGEPAVVQASAKRQGAKAPRYAESGAARRPASPAGQSLGRSRGKYKRLSSERMHLATASPER